MTTPGPVVAAPGGGFYVADVADCVIRHVDTAGTITTVAGIAGQCGDTGDGGPATSAKIEPWPGAKVGLALDASGDLYFVQSTTATLREIMSDGTIRAVNFTFTGGPYGLASDANGVVYLLDANGGAVGGGTIRTLAADDTTTTVKTLDNALAWEGLAAGGDGQLAVLAHMPSTPGAWVVEAIDLPGATTRHAGSGFASGAFILAIAADGTVYAEPGQIDGTPSHEIVRIAPDNTQTVIAGDGSPDPATAAQTGTATKLALSPAGIALTPNDSLLISSGHVVYRLEQPDTAPAPSA